MGVNVETLEANMVKLTIEVSEEKFEKALDQAYNREKSKIFVPGFRKGKVPRKIVERMYGDGFFYEDAANLLIPAEYELAAEESGLELVSRPEINIEQIGKNLPFIFTAEVAVKPEVTLGQYKGVEVPKADLEVTEEELSAEIEEEREKFARFVSVDNRPVLNGDMILLDFKGFIDGVPFEGGEAENYPLTVGSGAFIPGFEEQLTGKSIDETFEVKVTFPEEYQVEELAGKEAVFNCKINNIKEKDLPELDDDFAQDVSKFDTFEEYKEDVKAKLAEEKAEVAKQKKEDAVIEKIIENSQMEVPDAMIDTQARRLVDNFAERLNEQGLDIDEYLKFTDTTLEDLVEQMEPNAIKRIQSRLVLEAVANAEGVEVTEEEIQAEIARSAEYYHMEAAELEKALSKSEKADVKIDIAIEKAIKIVMEAAKEV